MYSRLSLVVVALISSYCGNVIPYSTYAPDDSCFAMTPGHGKSPQTSLALYKVEASPKLVKQGGMVTVIVTGNIGFKGFYVQARNVHRRPVGHFIRSKHDDVSIYNCDGGISNAACHVSPENKTGITILWKAPRKFYGEVTFTSSFVQSHNVFCTFVKANPVTLITNNTAA